MRLSLLHVTPVYSYNCPGRIRVSLNQIWRHVQACARGKGNGLPPTQHPEMAFANSSVRANLVYWLRQYIRNQKTMGSSPILGMKQTSWPLANHTLLALRKQAMAPTSEILPRKLQGLIQVITRSQKLTWSQPHPNKYPPTTEMQLGFHLVKTWPTLVFVLLSVVLTLLLDRKLSQKYRI